MRQGQILAQEIRDAPCQFGAYVFTGEDRVEVKKARTVAGKLWPEVCWSALPCLKAGAPMRQALETGLYEWDLTPAHFERGA